MFLAYLYIRGPEEKSSSFLTKPTHSSGGVEYGRLKEYQKETSIKTNLRRKQVEILKELNNSELESTSKESFHQTEIPEFYDPRTEVLAEESTQEAMNLDQRMDQFLAKRQQYENMEEVARKAYVKQFVQEAYKMGFLVKINDQMEIESVREINKQ